MKKMRSPRKSGRLGANHLRRLRNNKGRRRAWFRGKNLFRYAMILTAAGALTYGGFTAWKAYRSGQVLALTKIEVTGNRLWESSRLLERAGLEVGSRLPEISLSAARNAVAQLPGIQEVKVSRSLGGSLRVEIREEEMVAVRKSGTWQGLMASGVWLSLPSGKADLPIITSRTPKGTDFPALARFLNDARMHFPDLYAGFSQITPVSGGEIEIYWRDRGLKVRADYMNKSLNSLEFLRSLLSREAAFWTDGSTVDLRVEGYAYVL